MTHMMMFAALAALMLAGHPAVDEARATGTCPAECVGDARTCVHAGATAKLACRAECKQGGGHVGACLRECRRAFRGERVSCRTSARACASRCDDGGDGGGGALPDPACPGRCGAALGRCLHDAAGGMPGCLGGCGTGHARHACVQECVATAGGGRAQCRAEHQACLDACDGPSTTTSTTTPSTVTTTSTFTTTTTSTTVPPPPSCAESEAPSCGGPCPDAGFFCAEISAGVCGCIAGSPAAAFVRKGWHGRH